MHRFAILSLNLLSVASVALMAGCDDRSADKQVQADIAKSQQRALSGTEEDVAAARQLLESAAANNAASPAVQANAKALLAQVELEAARDAQRDVERQMMDVSRIVSEITQLGQQIATTNALVAGYREYDPKQALEAIEQSIADATGGPDRPAWFEHEDSQIPTLAVVRQDISRLEGEISAQQQKLNQLTQQRTAVLAERDQAARAAEEVGSEESLAAFKRASELRKQAADLATDIDNVEAALRPLQEDLAVAQKQEQVITQFVADLQQQAEAQRSGWQLVQQQMTAQAALARAILQGVAGSSGAATVVPIGGSISNKAAGLSEILSKVQSLREQALDNARNAASHYDQAASKADALRIELSSKIDDQRNQSRPEQRAWRTLRDVMHPSVFRLRQAAAQRTLASILAVQAYEQKLRIELRNALIPILEAANLQVPDELQATNLEREREQTLAAANEAFEQASTLLENITEGHAQEEAKNAAYVARILTLYAWSELNRDAGDTKAAEEHLEHARQLRNAAAERNVVLPTMPDGLGAPPAPAPEVETTTPPVEGAAPAPAPSDAPESSDPATVPAESTPAEPAPTEPAPAEPPPAEPGATPPPERPG